MRLIDADKLKADLEKAISKNEDMDCLDFLRVASFIDAQPTAYDPEEYNPKNEKTWRPDWCPLRELPERSDHPEHCDNGRFDAGWNACLDAIDGGAHGKEQSE